LLTCQQKFCLVQNFVYLWVLGNRAFRYIDLMNIAHRFMVAWCIILLFLFLFSRSCFSPWLSLSTFWLPSFWHVVPIGCLRCNTRTVTLRIALFLIRFRFIRYNQRLFHLRCLDRLIFWYVFFLLMILIG
jgi:hypothetical protein